MEAPFVATQIRRSLNTCQLEVEDMLSHLSDDLSVGDDGVAEAIVGLENGILLVQARLKKKYGEE